MSESTPSSCSDPRLRDEIGWLLAQLPPFVKADLTGGEPDYYGASLIVARELGLADAPKSCCGWSHGWDFAWDCVDSYDPRSLVGWARPDYPLLVSREKQAQFLRSHGFKYAIATGVPFVYQRPLGMDRHEGTLLVMPPHSSDFSSHDWDENGWVSYVQQLRPHFTQIVACVHRACVGRYWTKNLEAADIPWVTGSDPSDANALARMRALFEAFEFVNSPILGSQFAYAAYAGAKPSLSGPELNYSSASYETEPFYQLYPHLVASGLEQSSRGFAVRNYAFLCREPNKAETLRSWGAEMLGEPFKRPYEEIARLLGWRYDPAHPAYRGVDFASVAAKLGWKIDPVEQKPASVETPPCSEEPRTVTVQPLPEPVKQRRPAHKPGLFRRLEKSLRKRRKRWLR